ncbi:SprT family zinc-dependent metalloprotease [Pseudomonas sp. NW5]|uniref:SprT family zinc-dependent metalloprotease n=1 Tax=Pseudomonas sp. NW5 TaxID=2934934 RepID=UPI0020203142|nr:SprT family zinc-dependent metalloprotease [Pseudomonas sp. NW5]MCL7461686.1 SprT family zinc-dependent metalloprotease [Pseudomonas sp. NW5]
MPDQLLARVEACYQQAERFFTRSFARPSVSLRLRGLKAGVAHLQENHLRFNAQLYRENRVHFLQQTVAHEVAHLIAHQLYGASIRPHGPQWQAIMTRVYGLPAERCHHYAVKRPQRVHYLYRCACPDGQFPFTARRHALVLEGRRYLCRRCRTALTFSGECNNTTD